MIKRFFLFYPVYVWFWEFQLRNHIQFVQGDNPYNIAKKYGMTVDELLKLNQNIKMANWRSVMF